MATIRKRKHIRFKLESENYSASKTFPSLQSARFWSSAEETRILKEGNIGYKYKPFNLAEILVQYEKYVLSQKENHPDKWVIKAYLKLDWITKPLDQLTPQDVVKIPRPAFKRDKSIISPSTIICYTKCA